MIIIGLDVSTKTGYAVMEDGKLIDYGLLKVEEPKIEELEDFVFLKRADMAVESITNLLDKYKPDLIFCEQTNAGKFRSSQKQLEFIHCKLLTEIRSKDWTKKFYYVDTSKWRSSLSIKLSKEQRLHNKKVKSGSARGKVTPKHLVVSWANKKFNLTLLKKDHDICDAIALCEFGHSEFKKPKTYQYDLDKILKT
jgi:Holliday junction resolvasome RuvABC endonuclease subunit